MLKNICNVSIVYFDLFSCMDCRKLWEFPPMLPLKKNCKRWIKQRPSKVFDFSKIYILSLNEFFSFSYPLRTLSGFAGENIPFQQTQSLFTFTLKKYFSKLVCFRLLIQLQEKNWDLVKWVKSASKLFL